MSKKKVVRHNANHLDVVNQSWSEVDDIYQVLGEAIIEIAGQVNNSIKLIIQNGLETDTEINIAVNGIKRDIEHFTGDLKSIKSRHSDMSGTIDDEDQFALSCSVFNDYVILNERFKAIIFNPMLTITEKLSAVQKNEVVDNG